MEKVVLDEVRRLYDRAVASNQVKLAFGLGLILRVARFPEKVKTQLIGVAAAVLGAVEAAQEVG